MIYSKAIFVYDIYKNHSDWNGCKERDIMSPKEIK